MQPLDQSLAQSFATMQVFLTTVVILLLCSLLLCLGTLLVTLWVKRSGKSGEEFKEEEEVEGKEEEDPNQGFVSAENFLKGWSERRVDNGRNGKILNKV